MNTFSNLLVSARQDALLAEAAAERLARASRTPDSDRPNRLADAVKSVWSLLSGPAERPMTLPTLTNYPYRG